MEVDNKTEFSFNLKNDNLIIKKMIKQKYIYMKKGFVNKRKGYFLKLSANYKAAEVLNCIKKD